MERLSRLAVKIFADGADFDDILALYKNPLIRGFTTNPSLMRKAGIDDYEEFARRLFHRDAKGAGYSIEAGRQNRQASSPGLVPHQATV
jgi:transaldolase